MSVDLSRPSTNGRRAAPQEAERRAALRRYDILDTPSEAAFDRITELAAHLFDAPMAVINFKGRDRYWVKSAVGLDDVEQSPSGPFCAHALQAGGVTVVEDAAADARFQDDRLVSGPPNIRFYAGTSLETPDGVRIGTLGVFDTAPQAPSDAVLRQLENLAEMVVDELELRRQVSERTRTEEKVRRIVENAQPIVFMIDQGGTFLLSEGRDLDALGLEPGEAVGASVYDMFAAQQEAIDLIDRALSGETAADIVSLDDMVFDVWCAPFHDASGEVGGCIGMALDVTERTRAQDALEQNRDRLRRTQSIANVGGWEYDLDADVLSMTDEGCRIHGVPPGTTFDRATAFSFYPEPARSRIEAATRRAIVEGTCWELELPFVTADGEQRWVRSIGEPRTENGRVVKLVGAAQDVTERRAAEEALRDSERRHREFMERSPVGIYRSTPDGRVLFANDALIEMLGFTSFEELAARDLEDEGFAEDDRAAFEADLTEKGFITQRETEWIRADGSTVEVLESAHVVEENGTTVYEGVVEDITDRKRAERKLRRSRERLKNAQRIAGLGSWERNVEEDTLHWSDETRRIFGWDDDEPVTYDAFMRAVHPEDQDALREKQARLVEAGEPIDVRYRVVRPHGENRIVHERGEATFNDAGEVVRVSGTVLDVTEREKAKRQFQKSNQRLRLALEAANAGTFEFDVATGRSHWDDRTLEIYGREDQEPEADPSAFFSLVHPEDRSDLKATLKEALRSKDQYELSYRVVQPGGEERHVLSSGIVERDETGEAVRIIGLNQDITERKRAEQQLRRSRQRWQRLVSAHRDPIQIAVDGTIRYINPAGAEMFGATTPDEIIGRSVLDFAPNQEITDAIRRRKQKLDRGEPTPPFEHQIIRLDGERRIIEAYSVPIEYNGEQAAQTVLRDVTEQRTAEKALRDSKEELEEERRRLEMALVGGELGLWDANLDTGAAVYDARWARMLGYSMDEVEPTRDFFESLVHPEDLRKVYEALGRQARGEIDVMAVDIRMKAKDGSWRWIRDKGKIMEWNDDGTPHRAVGTHQDVTEEIQRQEALRRSRQKYKSLFDASNEAIFIHDMEGTIRDVNSKARTLFGYSHDTFVGRNVADLVPDGISRVDDELHTVRQGGSVHAENRYRRSDGTLFWGELSATAFEIDGERLVQGMIRDITDRKQAEQARRESEARLRGLANSIPGIIFQFYARPDGEHGFYFLGEQTETLLGLDPGRDDFFKQFADRIDPSYQEEFQASVEEAAATASFWNMELPFCKPSGETIWVQGVATPEQRENELVFNGVLLDITRRKQLQSQLRQAQKMETVGTLAGGIAHDFNNILHAAMVYLRMALEDLPEAHATADFLARAEKGLKRAEGLVDKLLTFSRQEGKTVEENVNVSAVIRETMELVESSVPDRVEMRVEMNEDCTVIGDPGQLQQVAMNLLTNAAQALKSQDETASFVLDVEVRSTEVDRDLASRYLNLDPGRYVRISISDTGPGMDQETKERIFEPFFTTKEVGKGTGLGLSVVHGIVQAHEGEVTVFTQPGEGTTFNVYLPCASETASTDTRNGAAPGGPSGHILFVDDDEQVLDLETVRLRGFGYEVTTRQTARAALDAIETTARTYDLVLTDYAMPGMSGMTLIRELKDRGCEVPIILMSGFSAKVSEEDVLQAGAEMFLRKPVGSNELEDALETALQ
jgi:PAS domain S-box-containing protein